MGLEFGVARPKVIPTVRKLLGPQKRRIMPLLGIPRSFVIVAVACYGEVWTDEGTNILRMSEHYELPGKWKHYQGVVTCGWLQRMDEPPRLIPLTISTQAKHNKKIYWCRGRFTDYQIFSSRVKIVAN